LTVRISGRAGQRLPLRRSRSDPGDKAARKLAPEAAPVPYGFRGTPLVANGVRRRLFAGGKWIRTIGTWKISFRFETDFHRIRDDSGFRTSSISTCARMPPHMPAEARGEQSCGFVEPASAERPNRASERAASEGRLRAASPLINRFKRTGWQGAARAVWSAGWVDIMKEGMAPQNGGGQGVQAGRGDLCEIPDRAGLRRGEGLLSSRWRYRI
jgi:hypothetical protein